MNITRTYDIYTIRKNDGKKVVISLTENDYYIKGVSGRKINSVPKDIGYIGDSLAKYSLRRTWGDPVVVNVTEYANRLISLSDYDFEVRDKFFCLLERTLIYRQDDRCNWKRCIKELKDICSSQEKQDAFIKTFNDNVDGNYYNYDLSDYLNEKEFNVSKFYSDEALTFFSHNLNRNNYLILRKYSMKYKAYREAIKHLVKQELKNEKVLEEMKKKLFELCGGNMGYDEIRDLYNINVEKRSSYSFEYNVRNLSAKTHEIEDAIKFLNIDYQITNIERDYEQLIMMRFEKQCEEDNKFFKEHQNVPHLNYENEKYKIYIPTSREELGTIGNYFSNCANGWEWNNRLRYGNYYLVVVVDKEADEFRVCVDIDKKNKKISQYLGRSNCTINDKSLLDFEKEYQKHLLEKWD